LPHYQVKIQVSAARVPDFEPQPVFDPGKDPLTSAMAQLGQIAANVNKPSPFNFFRPSGLELTKEIEIRAESFDDLAKALGQFDSLAEQIECANPVKEGA
jgi:hypothetical protein